MQPPSAAAWDRTTLPEWRPTYTAVVRSVGIGLVALSAVAGVLVVGHQMVSGAHTPGALVLVALTQVAVVAAGALLLRGLVLGRRPSWSWVLAWGSVVLLAMVVAGTRQYDVDVPVRVATMLGPVAAIASALRTPTAHVTMLVLLAAGWEVEHRSAPAWATTLTIEVAVFYAFMAIAFQVIRRTALTAEANIARLAATERMARASEAVARERVLRLRTLHDGALSTLTAVAHGVPADPAALRRRCASDLALLDQYAAPDLDADAPPAEVESALRDVVGAAREAGLVVDLRIEPPPTGSVSRAAANALVGGAREALANVSRHAGTSSASVVLDWPAATVRLVVEDCGCGFEPAGAAGVGIRECLEGRARAAGGRVDLRSGPGAGTRIEILVPRELGR